ncbi:MAG: hypothetical protein L0387_25290 [Acidobacteria bacterium]|nr:hypothetical protein [Acidobacteriota bacterium]
MRLDPVTLIDRYRSKGVLVDTNLLLLFVVGVMDRSRIEKHDKLSHYTVEDFDLLVRVLNQFTTRVTTPNILTEVSNLVGVRHEHGQLVLRLLKEMLTQAEPMLDEQHVPTSRAANFPRFETVGVTDSGIAEIARGRYLVLTSDFPLSEILVGNGIDAVNFTHIRPIQAEFLA